MKDLALMDGGSFTFNTHSYLQRSFSLCSLFLETTNYFWLKLTHSIH